MGYLGYSNLRWNKATGSGFVAGATKEGSQ
jgi:hypothetical protein